VTATAERFARRAGGGLAFTSLSRAIGAKRAKLSADASIDEGDFFEGDTAAETDRRRRKGGR